MKHNGHRPEVLLTDRSEQALQVAKQSAKAGPHGMRRRGFLVEVFQLGALVHPFLGEGSPKIDYRKKGTLILSPLLEDPVISTDKKESPGFVPFSDKGPAEKGSQPPQTGARVFLLSSSTGDWSRFSRQVESPPKRRLVFIRPVALHPAFKPS